MIKQIIASLLMLGNTQPIIEKTYNENQNVSFNETLLDSYTEETIEDEIFSNDSTTIEDDYKKIYAEGTYFGNTESNYAIPVSSGYDPSASNITCKAYMQIDAKKQLNGMQLYLDQYVSFIKQDMQQLRAMSLRVSIYSKILVNSYDTTMQDLYDNNMENMSQFVNIERQQYLYELEYDNVTYERYYNNTNVYTISQPTQSSVGYIILYDIVYNGALRPRTPIENNYDYIIYPIEINLRGNQYEVTSIEVIDMPDVMWTILTMPFTFISIAFNLTLWPNTGYALNIGNLVLVLLGILIFIFIMKIIIKASASS